MHGDALTFAGDFARPDDGVLVLQSGRGRVHVEIFLRYGVGSSVFVLGKAVAGGTANYASEQRSFCCSWQMLKWLSWPDW
jgi:hypothetical protein